jgi:hypothetical protein
MDYLAIAAVPLGGIALWLALGWLIQRAAERAPRPEPGWAELEYGTARRLAATALAMAAVLFAYQAGGLPEPAREPMRLAALALIGYAAAAAHETYLTQVMWSREGILAWSFLRGTRALRWDEIAGGGFSPLRRAFWFEDRDGRRLWLSPRRQGWRAFQDFALTRLRKSRAIPATPSGEP